MIRDSVYVLSPSTGGTGPSGGSGGTPVGGPIQIPE